MGLANLDHYNINTSDLDRAVQFYTDILGLRKGPRPEFGIPGAWLYLGDTAVLHLIVVGKDGKNGSGAIDHVAFRANDYDAMRANLQKREIKFAEMDVPDFKVRQIFVHDPDGVKIELNFFYG